MKLHPDQPLTQAHFNGALTGQFRFRVRFKRKLVNSKLIEEITVHAFAIGSKAERRRLALDTQTSFFPNRETLSAVINLRHLSCFCF